MAKYISPNGNDGNPGTQELPWLTVAKSNDAAPGEARYFERGGTYNGLQLVVQEADLIGAYGNGARPIINLALANVPTIYINAKSGWILQDLEITCNDGASATNHAIRVEGDCSTWSVRRCTIRDCDAGFFSGQIDGGPAAQSGNIHDCHFTQTENDAISCHEDGQRIIINCTFDECGGAVGGGNSSPAIGTYEDASAYIARCTFTNCQASYINFGDSTGNIFEECFSITGPNSTINLPAEYVSMVEQRIHGVATGVGSIIVRNNLFILSETGTKAVYAIAIDVDGLTAPSASKIYNNTFLSRSTIADSCFIKYEGAGSKVIQNNTFHQVTRNHYFVRFTSIDVASWNDGANNNYHHPTLDFAGSGANHELWFAEEGASFNYNTFVANTTELGGLNVDPGYVGDDATLTTAADLRLAVGSLLINAGVDLTGEGVTRDYYGIGRPAGAFDVGGSEYALLVALKLIDNSGGSLEGTITLTTRLQLEPNGFEVQTLFGNPDALLQLDPDGFEIEIAFGQANISLDQELVATGFEIQIGFGTVDVRLAVQFLDPDGFEIEIPFGTATVSTGVQFLEPNGFAIGIPFGQARLLPGLNPNGFEVEALFGTPAITQTIEAIGFEIEIAFGQPIALLQLDPNGVEIGILFGEVEITIETPGDQDIDPNGFAIGVSFGVPTLQMHLLPVGQEFEIAFGTPSLSAALNPNGFEIELLFGTPELTQTVVANGFEIEIAFGTTLLSYDQELNANGFEVEVNFGLAIAFFLSEPGTPLDESLIPAIYDLVQRLGKFVQHTRRLRPYDVASGTAPFVSAQTQEVKVTPPSRYTKKFGNEDVTRTSNLQVYMPAKDLQMVPQRSDLITFDGITHNIVEVHPIYSGVYPVIYGLELEK